MTGKTLFLLASPMLFSLAPKYDGDRTGTRFFYEIGPFMKNEDIVMYWHFNYSICKTATFYLRLTDSTKQNFYFQTTSEHDFRELGDGIYDGVATIPAKYLTESTVYISYGIYGIQPGISFHGDWGDYGSLEHSLASKYAVSTLFLTDDKKIDVGRKWVYSGVWKQEEYSEYINFYSSMKPSAMKRSMGLECFGLSHVVEKGLPLEIHPTVELRIISHLEYFESLGKKVGSGKASFIRVPVEAVRFPSRDGENELMYAFQTASTFRVSCVNYRMEDSSRPNSFIEPTFNARTIFVPMGVGHDYETFQFQIMISNLPSCPSLAITKLVKFETPVIGNCDTAQYCVVLGD